MAEAYAGSMHHTMFWLTLLIAVAVGVVMSLPEQQDRLARMAGSVAIAATVCVLVWLAGGALGMDAAGATARMFASVVFASAACSVFHAYLSEKPTLR